jgi:hypothetical protein
MPECSWCHKRGKTLKLDAYDRCQECQDAARYPLRPTRSFRIRLVNDGHEVGMQNGGRSTYPVGEDYQRED